MNEISYNSRIAQYAKLNKISEEEAKKELEQQGETYEEERQSDIQNAVNDTEGSLSALSKQAEMKKQGTVISETLQKQGEETEYQLKGITFSVTKLSNDAKFSYTLSGNTLTIKSSKNCVININEVTNKNLIVNVDSKSSYITLNSNAKVKSITNNANNSIINGSAEDDNIINNGKNCIIHAGKGKDKITNIAPIFLFVGVETPTTA